MASNDSVSDVSLRLKSSKSKALPLSILLLRDQLPPITSVASNATYNYFGTLHPELIVGEASRFLSGHSDAAISDSARTLSDFLQITLQDYLDDKRLDATNRAPFATWFTIRMTTPSLQYTEMPRWHRDGRMFRCDVEGEVNSKYAITLLGNPTKVLAESDLVREVVRGRYSEKREEFAERLALEPILRFDKGEIIRFSWGQADSPVHSEPDLSFDRVFVSVLYGSEREILDMCKIRERMYRE